MDADRTVRRGGAWTGEVAPSAAVTELVQRAGDGDDGALAVLYDRLSPKVFGLIARMLPDRPMAEQTLQDVFVDVWRDAASFDSARGSGETWIMSIAHRRAVAQARAIRRAIAESHEGGGTPPFPLPADTSADRVDDLAEGGGVHAATRTLSTMQRTIVSLAYLDGYSQPEIAELTGIPLSTVRSATRDALERLRPTLP